MAATADGAGGDGVTRRDFLEYAAGGMGAVGAGATAWAFIDNMNPAADVLALSTTEVDLEPIEPGQSITVVWQKKPVFVRRRTEAEIREAEETPLDSLPDPMADADRVQKAEWLILVGVCTHLGCIPLGQKDTDERANTEAGSAPATARTTTPRGASARGRRRRTCPCRRTSSSTIPAS